MTAINMTPPVVWIKDQNSFASVAASWMEKPFLAMDTEFERRTTYYPILALLQIFDGETIYLVDPLKVSCPEELRATFANPNVVKIFHAGKEDLEVLFCSWQCRLAGLFDTQVAYAFAEGVSSIGYANLVNELCQQQLDKEATQSDWLARPLSEQQLDYAAKDVLYLPTLYSLLKEKLSNNDVARYFAMECHEMCQQVTKTPDYDSDYREAKEVSRLNAEQLGLFKQLYQWREETAMRDDRTRNHIAKDGLLVNIAAIKPDSKRALQTIAELHPRTIRQYGDQIVSLIAEYDPGQHAPLSVVPNPRDVEYLNTVSNALLGVVSQIAKTINITPGNIASKRLVRKIALAYLAKEPCPNVWSGWRGDLLKPHFDPIISQFIATHHA